MSKYVLIFFVLLVTEWVDGNVQPAYDFTKLQRERLGRGVIAIRHSPEIVCVSWRYLSSDPMTQWMWVFTSIVM